MKIILGVDTIAPPLTGTGRYALELARRLPGSDGIEEVLFFAHGRFVSGEKWSGPGMEWAGSPVAFQHDSLSMFKRGVTQSVIAARAYGKVVRTFGKFRLRRYSDYLVHGLSFVIPPCSGPSVATIHDLSVYRYPKWHPESRSHRVVSEMDKTLRVASHLITDTEAVRQEIIDFFSWPPQRITAVPLGVSNIFYPRGLSEITATLSSLGLEPGKYSLCVATVEPRKNIVNLIDAFEMLPVTLRKKYPLVIAGFSGWKSADIHKRISRAVRKGFVRYIGYVPEYALPALYSGCRAFLYPSLYEGFGLPLLEAMACGAPVMTSNCSCMPEVAGNAGFLVDPEDVPSISEGIERVLTDEKLRSFAIDLGLERARLMTWDATVQKTIEVYRLVLNKETGSS